MIQNNELYIIYGKQYRRMVRELLQRTDLSSLIMKKCGRKDALVTMKPNMVSSMTAEEGATTHPLILEEIIRYLQENGFTNLAVMEGSWVGDLTSDAVQITGIDRVCRKSGVPFYDLQKDSSTKVDMKGMEIHVCDKILESDFLINLPVMKGHCQTRMTCALKNMKGCITNAEKRRFHRLGLHDPIGHLGAGLKQDFILVDSICSDLTMEDGGNPVQQDRLMAAVDPVLCDTYVLRIMGIDEEEVPYVGIAESLGGGSMDIDHAHVTCLLERKGEGNAKSGAQTEDGGEYFYIEGPDREKIDRSGDYTEIIRQKELVQDVDSCSACYGSLIPALNELEKEGLLKNFRGRICIGQGYRGKTGEIGIGNCTRKFKKSLAGCPPKSEEMAAFLRENLTEK